MAENDSSLKEKRKLAVSKHLNGIREIFFTSSAQTLVSDEEISKISPNQLSPLPTPSAAATCIGYCADIFTQILLRLPPKSLLRFQCVSKQWHSVISNSDFRRLHCRTFHTSCLSPEFDAWLLLRSYVYEVNIISFSWENVKPRLSSYFCSEIWGLHSSNGLLCIQFIFNNEEEIIVYNPTTNCHRLIPKCKFADDERFTLYRSVINICFDPLKSDHYKLVAICVDNERDAYYFSIYSSETGIWKDANFLMEFINPEEFTNPEEDFCTCNGIFWNGNLHWINESNYVFCFDLNKESLDWSVPSLPTLEQGTTDCWYFGESGGCLCAIEKSSTELMLFHIFLMERDYSGWFLKASMDLNPLTLSYPSMNTTNYHPRFHFTHFLWCNNEKKAKLVISMVGKIILYNVSDKSHKTVTELVDVEPMNRYYRWKDLYNWDQKITFIATLACV